MFLCICKAKNGSKFKVSSLRAIRGAIDRYLTQLPHNKPWSIIDDSKFAKANQTLNAFCKNMMKEGRVGPVVHKNPTTSEQMEESFISGQLLAWRQHTRSLATAANGLVLLDPLLWKKRTRTSTKTYQRDDGFAHYAPRQTIL